MQDDTTVATSTPSEDVSVRASLEEALGDWGKIDSPSTGDVTTDIVARDEVKSDPAEPAETEPKGDDRARDERGRFTKREGEGEQTEEEVRAQWEDGEEEKPADEAEPPADGAEAPEQQEEADSSPQQVEGKPPPGWSVQSKAEWDQLPPHIRADIVKREQEVDEGFKTYSGLGKYVEMARSSGTTLDVALERYVNAEQALRQDPIQGLLNIAKNMGLTQQQLQQAFGGAPTAQPPQNGQYQNGANGHDQQGQNDYDDPYVREAVNAALRPVTEEIGSLKTYFETMQKADQERQVSTAQQVIDEFKSSDAYRYFPNVEDTINRLFEGNMVNRTGDFRADLKTAYDMACNLHPEVREALINDRIRKTEEERKAAAAKAAEEKRKSTEAKQRAAVSVRGAPSGQASNPAGASKGSVRDDLLAAWDGIT